jgi:DNA primase
MAKIAQISAKYIIHASINIDGIVDRPDVIGAIFGQTEGLLGNDLELRELQRSGRIGRIEVNLSPKAGKASGEIIIPSSLDKAETAIVAAALEIIARIGPCNAKIHTESIEDIRISKRQYVIERAKELLKTLMDDIMPDSQELAEEVAVSVRIMEIQEWGKDRLPAGPGIDESDEIILVEGRADVLNLLKQGFKNVISMNGTSIPDSVKDLCRQKIVTVFVDGDRGGDLIIKELLDTTEIDFITKAPDGKEVEELAKKEIHKSLRAKIAAEQWKLDGKSGLSLINERRRTAEYEIGGIDQVHETMATRPQAMEPRPQQGRDDRRGGGRDDRSDNRGRDDRRGSSRDSGRDDRRGSSRDSGRDDNRSREAPRDDRRSGPRDSGRDDRESAPSRDEPRNNAPKQITDDEKQQLGKLLEDLLGSHGAYVLDSNLKILGKVPGTELVSTIKALKTGMHAVVFDGQIDQDLLSTCEQANVNYVAGMSAAAKGNRSKVFTAEDLL